MINARMETVTSTPAYRALIPKASRRALQIADGYFEWPQTGAARGAAPAVLLSGWTAVSRSPSPRCGHRRRCRASGSRASRCSPATPRPTAWLPGSTIACR